MSRRFYIAAAVVLVSAAVAAAGLSLRAGGPEPASAANATVTVARKDFVRSVRLNGTVEAVESTSIPAPRLAGQNNNSLVIMRLVPNGATVKRGDVLVEFDRQDQIRNALDRRADLTDLEQQIKQGRGRGDRREGERREHARAGARRGSQSASSSW